MTFGVRSVNVSEMLLKDVEGEYISLEHKGVTASPPALLEIEAGGNSLKLVLEHNSVALV